VPVTDPLKRDEIEEAYEENTGRVIVRRFHEIDPLQMPAVLVAIMDRSRGGPIPPRLSRTPSSSNRWPRWRLDHLNQTGIKPQYYVRFWISIICENTERTPIMVKYRGEAQ